MTWLFWAVAAVLTALSVGALLHPLLRRPAGAAGETAPEDREAYDLHIYRDQLAEIDRDLARGVLTEREADAARLEVQRRLLAADRRRVGGAVQAAGEVTRRRSTASRMAALAVVVVVPLGALATYLSIGEPDLPSLPRAERSAEVEREGEMREMVADLQRRLAENPDDARGWQLLGRARAEMGDWEAAAEAYQEAVARGGAEEASLQSALGEALTAAAGGTVSPRAAAAFAAALEADPQEPRARYYTALALKQGGQVREALDLWLELAETTPRDAGWRPLLREQIVMAAEDLGLPLAELSIPAGPEPRGGPMAEQEAAVEDMSPEEREAFIRSMVEGLADRLEEDPDDIDGWLRLVQARLVLGETDAALAALERAEPLVAELPADDRRRQAVEEGLRLLGDGS
ncbi:c-type cytochrome biogenesis protein CcmI [Aquibaculum arenosum]|uniref:C-type cytochrome biogenesis protein CcmI n=1 Tax=Aquibaculum arenosum TaxID=3032591 RepID=A0ABT5YMT4_9PROT|nr:c-type cytochrome biogenesis protein CcmI [Fodinicurvata sp. CAU 1616]MDF2095574.1 c-type cytochrome biogenesis protein CcmI [Fodinicurvata sp. CAU 1616]